MNKGFKKRIPFEVIIILGILAAFCLILRLWPLVFMVVPGILIAAVRLLFVSMRKRDDVPLSEPQEPPRPDTEQDIIRIAFGVLLRRITEHVTARYPAARWIWETPNPMERFSEGLKLVILLNNAGGFARAEVSVRSLSFTGISYISAAAEPPAELDADGDPGSETADYALVAFQWTEANLLALNADCNNAIAGGHTTMLIPACNLPNPDSWGAVCDELMRNGFTGAASQYDGICVTLPK